MTQMDCSGVLKVTLALAAAPDISSNPTDIVLILDCSGSMSGSPLANMKEGAKTFIDIIDEATDGTLDADGLTNHADAFSTAAQLFDPASSNAKVMVMFTDGKTTAGPPPGPVAAAARTSGIIIYCIGLIGSDGIDVAVLNDWATDPDASHVAVTPDDSDLEELFADLAANISKPGATNIVIDEKLNPDFVIFSVNSPDKGTATVLDATTLQWKIPSLGVSGNEGASLDFFIRHTGQMSGTKKVNASIIYSDDENNAVTFPEPEVFVQCGIIVHPEPCPVPIDFSMEGCQDSLKLDLGDVYLESQGRIVQFDLTLKNICPGKRTALAVILTEIDTSGNEQQRGLKIKQRFGH